MKTVLTPGARFDSSVCSTSVIVINPGAQAVDLRCGGFAMVPHGSTVERGEVHEPFGQGTLVGKRYTSSADGTLEILVTRAGAGSLSDGDSALEFKQAKALPSSD